MKKALALAGGGTRGSYQNGALRALREEGKDDFQIVTGTSIGALNAALVVQKDYDAMDELWHTLTQDKIINGAISTDFNFETMINERNLLGSFFKNYIREQGADISPMIERIHKLYNPERFFASDIDFGCMCIHHGTLNPVYVTKEMMREHGEDWLIATASAFPAFPVHRFSEGDYVDGGYFDNLPIDYAFRLGADEVIAVDLNNNPNHPEYIGRSCVTYVFPQIETGNFLSFDREKLDLLETAGYNDMKKALGVYTGVKYTFLKAPLPAYLPKLIKALMMLDFRIRHSVRLPENLAGPAEVIEKLRDQQKKKQLSDEEIFWGLMDNLMELCGCDVTKVWTYEEARNAILAEFAPCAYEDYPYKPSIMPKDLYAYSRTLDTKGAVAKLVHGRLYPEHWLLTEQIRLTIYPFELGLAELVLLMMKDLGGVE